MIEISQPNPDEERYCMGQITFVLYVDQATGLRYRAWKQNGIIITADEMDEIQKATMFVLHGAQGNA